jgi:dUTP pyrophosphatase
MLQTRDISSPNEGPALKKVKGNDGEPIVPLKVKRLTEHAVLPLRASERAAGYDLFAAADCTIEALGKELVKTDIAIAIPPGYYGRIAPRSSLAWKSHLDVGAGVIDEDYRGPVGVVLFNLGKAPFNVRKGERIAQLVLTKITTPPVEEVDDLDNTGRAEGGFGSTGK